jgi:hypothetical protein
MLASTSLYSKTHLTEAWAVACCSTIKKEVRFRVRGASPSNS